MLKKTLFISGVFLCFVFMISCGENAKNMTNTGSETGDQAETSSDETASEDPAGDATDTEPAEERPGEEDDQENQEDQDEDPETDPDEDSGDPAEETIFVAGPSQDLETNTDALIVTREEFAGIFKKFADFHTVTGIITKVITIEDICKNTICDDDDPEVDTSKAIKDYVMSVEGLRYLILGGDIETVPSRIVHDHFELPLGIADYTDDFYSDLYYADFSDWDKNGNGIYAEDDDKPVLIANIAIGRISVSTVEEAELYFSKIVKHHTAFNTAHTTKSLLLAN
ncbi:hypothetical protein IKP13_07975, partial [bacterium]|nr:hypothetical protein [bacterium]